MRIPLSWLKEYISITLPPAKIAKLLTMAGLEVESTVTIGENLKEIIVVRVIETKQHPNADKLTLATVSDGKQTYQVVCGAPNCKVGMKTAFAPIRSTITVDDEVITIQSTKLRGIESAGMLCSEKELGLSDTHESIIELPNHLPEGTSLAEIFSDTYFEIALTPNLSHCSSIIGVARELSSLTGQPLRLPVIQVQEVNESIENNLVVNVVDQEDCPRYACRLIKNIQVAPSPYWLQERLKKCGVRSVNNVVDVTNFVLLEMGHPLHAFDYDKLEEQTIEVRKAKEGEKIQTLDGKENYLKETMLAICDKRKPVAIAGVMGGLDSEIQDQTENVVLESAYFDPISIRRTSRQLGLQTDASKRFEKGTDPNQVIDALNRATMMIQQITGGEVYSGVIDIQSKEFPEAIISCRLSRINHLLGRIFSRGEVENIFKSLQFSYQWDGQDRFLVRVPTYRVDIKAEIDLIEEVARVYGYDNIPRHGGRYQASSLPSVPLYLFEKKVRERFIADGLQEFLTCDLIGPTLLQNVQGHATPSESSVTVLNPTSIEQSILRTSLLPGLLQVVKYNVDHHNADIAGFEIGRVHFRDNDQYKENPVVGIILTGKSYLPHWSQKQRDVVFFDLKGIVENLLEDLGISNASFKNLNLETFHSGRQASIFVDSLEIGSFGEIHPAIQRRLDVTQRILFAELNLQDLLKLSNALENVKPLAIYPGSEWDWTITIKNSVPFAQIIELIQAHASALLESVSLKDIYHHEKLGLGYHNLTFHFVYRDPSKTIEREAVEGEHQLITQAVLNELNDVIKI